MATITTVKNQWDVSIGVLCGGLCALSFIFNPLHVNESISS